MNDYEIHIASLDGYLKCLRRFRSSGCSYWARAYPATDDIDQFLGELVSSWGSEYRLLGKKNLEFRDIEKRIIDTVFRGALNLENVESKITKQSIQRLIVEDINEYYGLISTSLNADGAFHPLISGPVYEVKVRNVDYLDAFIYLVKIEEIFVLTGFSRRKPSGKI
ncbi:MAG: hypothetical protein ACRBBW_15770 [Cellvibrionaceae bacterium]